MLQLRTPEDTFAFGERIGDQMTAGDLVLLSGPLGAGKTVVAKGIAHSLGVQGRVSSPTFIIAREHPAGPRGIPMVHVDAYRLAGDLAQLDDLDLDTELVQAAVVIEWGEGTAERLNPNHLHIHLTRNPDDTRHATLTPSGTWTTRLPVPA